MSGAHTCPRASTWTDLFIHRVLKSADLVNSHTGALSYLSVSAYHILPVCLRGRARRSLHTYHSSHVPMLLVLGHARQNRVLVTDLQHPLQATSPTSVTVLPSSLTDGAFIGILRGASAFAFFTFADLSEAVSHPARKCRRVSVLVYVQNGHIRLTNIDGLSATAFFLCTLENSLHA